eukprot:GHRR01018106.1.p1 GENE.GHRR01018106.1~~GHRR01018106.1.p1  ORF type:complete len:1124 (+),score=375.49 GHRR01018106.1:243-3374(+)
MLHDSFVLDLASMTWQADGAPLLPSDVCNNVCDGIESVPFHKVFSFGGKKGMMQYMNIVDVMDCGMQVWSTPSAEGSNVPCGREDTAWAYDTKTSSLLVFGGWASRWLGDLVKLNCAAIIGPPYACTSMSPQAGPVFGEKDMVIKGLRFKPGKVQVRFGNTEKNQVVVDAEYIDNETIHCKTANYEQFGPMPVDVKVSINGEGWTVNKLVFNYFANTAARNSMAFGPGVLPKVISGVEVPFHIQARDTINERRTSGGDNFSVRIVSADGLVTGDARITDLQDGRYEVHYSVPKAASYLVHISHADLGGNESVPLRGSPFKVHATDPWTQHRVLGSIPGRRKGATLSELDGELVLYGGDTCGLVVCSTSPGEWRWSSVTPSGPAPGDRIQHSVIIVQNQLVLFGGASLSDGTELADMFWLKKTQGGWAWGCPKSHTPYVRHTVAPGQEPIDTPKPVTGRLAHTAVALDQQMLVIYGEKSGSLLTEPCIVESVIAQVANWIEPILRGDVPAPRKGAAAAATGGTIIMLGGTTINESEQPVVLDELVVFGMESPNSLVCTINPSSASGSRPPARTGATMLEYSPGQLFLYGGFSADGKPFNDAYLLDVTTLAWKRVYNGHPDLVGSQGAMATLLDGKLVLINSSAGSPKLDCACSLDPIGLAASYSFTTRMKTEVNTLLENLEAWADKQTISMELAQNLEKLGQNFDSLLKVMDALYQVKLKKSENDLLIEQLRETLRTLAADKIMPTTKLEKRLEDVAHKWDDIKKVQPQVKSNVEPIQANQADKIREDIEAFTARVLQYKAVFHTKLFYKHCTGAAAAYPLLDTAASELAKLRKECIQFAELASIFELTDAMAPADAAIRELYEDLVSVKDVWDCTMMCEVQFQAWRKTLWSNISTEEMEEGAKNFVKEVKALPKRIRDEDVFRGLDGMVKNFLVSVPLVADLRSPAMRDRHWRLLMEATQVSFNVQDPGFKLDDLLALQLHKFEDEVGEIVDRAQKEEKMELGLQKLEESWTKVSFQFTRHKDTNVYTVKMAEEDFEVRWGNT